MVKTQNTSFRDFLAHKEHFLFHDNLQHKTSPSTHSLPCLFERMSQDSPLLALAPELRNKIYRLVLVSDAAIDIGSESSPTPPRLLGTCRQIRHEATSIYYHENTFAATDSTSCGDNYTRAVSWFCKIGSTRCAMMADMRLHLEIEQDFEKYGPEWLEDGTRSMLREAARASVHLLDAAGLPLSAIHFEAPSEIVTLSDAIRATWAEAGERDVQERVAANGLPWWRRWWNAVWR